MKFDMHCHTKEGSTDGRVMIEEYIRRLRGKMKEDTRQNKIITTVWGVGYKIEK